MKRYYKLLFFLALCVLGLSMVVAADIGKITVEITALEQQIHKKSKLKPLKVEIPNYTPPKIARRELKERNQTTNYP